MNKGNLINKLFLQSKLGIPSLIEIFPLIKEGNKGVGILVWQFIKHLLSNEILTSACYSLRSSSYK